MLHEAMTRFAGKALLRETYDDYIGNQWMAPADCAYLDNISPVNGQVVCKVARGMAKDIKLAVDAAHAAKDAWGRTSTTDRANILGRIAQRMEDNLNLLAPALAAGTRIRFAVFRDAWMKNCAGCPVNWQTGETVWQAESRTKARRGR